MVVIVEEDTILCRCLRISESSLADAVQRCPLANLQDVARETGAGSGCTACHRLIRRFLAEQRSATGCCGS
jgi:bacterioferritin-associated ferredoxin